MSRLHGSVFKYGDNINTDLISPPQYLEKSMDIIAQHAMEGVDELFARQVQPGDMIVAGSNFGPGSSRETAPIALKMAGVSVVIAKSFARIFFRNAINIGLPVLECNEVDKISAGDVLEVDLFSGVINNKTNGEIYQAAALSDTVAAVLNAGGLVPFLERRFGAAAQAKQ
jgi:3-isopropylmalate/(R)-2-methylmalate dehydratase small subunit